MATDHEEDREELIIDDAEAEAPEPDEIEPPEGADDEPPEGDDPPEDDEIEISFGDGEAPAERAEDSAVIRKMREELRKRDRELATLRKANEPKPIELGPRPTLESCQYDEELFATEHEAWLGDKAKADAELSKRREAQQAEQQAWQGELESYAHKKQALKIKNFDDLEGAVVAGLSDNQQRIIIKAADDSAKVIAALGLHPQKLADLAKITDLVKFTAAIVKLEGSLKVTTRRQAPNPDRPVRGSAPFSASNGKADAHREKLEREADRTGDRSKIVAYNREQRRKEQERRR